MPPPGGTLSFPPYKHPVLLCPLHALPAVMMERRMLGGALKRGTNWSRLGGPSGLQPGEGNKGVRATSAPLLNQIWSQVLILQCLHAAGSTSVPYRHVLGMLQLSAGLSSVLNSRHEGHRAPCSHCWKVLLSRRSSPGSEEGISHHTDDARRRGHCRPLSHSKKMFIHLFPPPDSST